MRLVSTLLVSSLLGLPNIAHCHDMEPFNEENVARALNINQEDLKKFEFLDGIFADLKGRRDRLKEDQILSSGGWQFVGSYFDRPKVEIHHSVNLDILLNQTHLLHKDSTFVIKRKTQVLRLELTLGVDSNPRATLHACDDPETYSTIYFTRPMTDRQLKDFIPNPILALGRLLSIGYGNIKRDPFAHFEQLMGIFNKVKGVDTTLTEEETVMVKFYADRYKTFEAGFAPGIQFDSSCIRGETQFIPVVPSQVLIFKTDALQSPFGEVHSFFGVLNF